MTATALRETLSSPFCLRLGRTDQGVGCRASGAWRAGPAPGHRQRCCTINPQDSTWHFGVRLVRIWHLSGEPFFFLFGAFELGPSQVFGLKLASMLKFPSLARGGGGIRTPHKFFWNVCRLKGFFPGAKSVGLALAVQNADLGDSVAHTPQRGDVGDAVAVHPR